MTAAPIKSRTVQRRVAGFSLVEILIALGIFLIGMVAIVSLFPAAAILQRETTQEVIGEMAAQSAAGIIESQRLTYTPPTGPAAPGTGDIGSYHSGTGSTNTDVVSIANLYSFADRSYPTGLVDSSYFLNADPSDDGLSITGCDLHWVPFIQDLNGDPVNPNWVVRLFILNADSRAVYTQGNAADANPTDPITFPKVRSVNATASGREFTAAGTDLEPGDVIMDNNGNSHEVVNVNGNTIEVFNTIPRVPSDPTTIWYAPRFGGNSPAQRIETVTVNIGQ